MPFDPDAYLAAKEAAPKPAAGFDADAYLASKEAKSNAPAAEIHRSWFDRLMDESTGAIVEPILKTTTGMGAKVAGEVAGLGAGALNATGVIKTDPADVQRAVQEHLTYRPRTTAGTSEYNPLNMIPRAIGAAIEPFLPDPAQDPTTMGGMVRNAIREAIPQAIGIAGAKFGPEVVGKTDVKSLIRGTKAEDGTRLATVQANAKEAHDAGYVLPPAQVAPTKLNDALGSWSGKKIEQKASLANQENTNRLIKEEFGLPKDAVLDDKTFSDIRKEAGKAYKAVQSITAPIKTDSTFRSQIAQIGGANSQAAREFPSLMANPEISNLRGTLIDQKPFTTKGAIEVVKQLRADATQNLKAVGDPSKHALGLAQREAAEHIDDLVERNLGKLNKPDLVNSYREARRTIAKAYDMESVTNTTTGNVSARGAARLMDKGKPLSGNLEKVAKFGAAFPQAAKNVEMLGNVTDSSALDFGLSLASVAHGRPDIAGAILARPLARNAQLSKTYQDAMFSTKPIGPKPNVVVPLSVLIQNSREDTQP